MSDGEQEAPVDASLDASEAPVITSALTATSFQRRTADVEVVVMSAFEAYAERLKAFALASVRDGAAADDLVQETFLRLVREVRGAATPDNIGGWLFRVCGNLIVSRSRRSSVAQRLKSRLIDRRVEASAEETALQRHDRGRLTAALAELPVDARVALLMAAQGAKSTEIAEAIGRTPGATRTYVCRARIRLRELMVEASEPES